MSRSTEAQSSNLAALTRFKRALHEQLPSIKSGHLSELIAAGFGQQTHAALLAHLQRLDVTFSSLPVQQDAFVQRAHALGYADMPYGDLGLEHKQMLAGVVQQVQEPAMPELGLVKSNLDRCHDYGVVMRRKPDGSIFATHPFAGALGPHATLEEAAADAVATWLN